jgi:signal peptidase I
MTKVQAAGAASEPKQGAVQEAWETVKTIVYALLIALVIRTLLFQPYTIPSASEEPNLYTGDYIIVSKWSYGYSRHSILFSPPVFNGRLFFHTPLRGDTIVFKLPSSGHVDYIKRLVGLPGDRVQMKGGRLYINDKILKLHQIEVGANEYLGDDAPVQWYQETNPEGRTYIIQHLPARTNDPGVEAANNTGVYVVPPHCYFMMGDNRDNSEDSRFSPGLAPEDPKLRNCGSGATDFLPASAGVGFVPEENLVGKAQIIMISWKEGSAFFKPWTWLNLRWDRFARWIK